MAKREAETPDDALVRLQADNKKLRAEVRTLKKEAKESAAGVDTLATRMESLAGDNNEAQAKVVSLSRSNAELTITVRALRTTIIAAMRGAPSAAT